MKERIISDKPLRFRQFCVWLLLIISGFRAEGATVSWIGGSGDWNTPANWSTGALPGPNDAVMIGTEPNITVTHWPGQTR